MGFEIDLNSKCDIVAFLGSTKFSIECKRLQSQKQIPNRAKDAYRQLIKRYSIDKALNVFGMIFLNISKALNPNFFDIYSKSMALFI